MVLNMSYPLSHTVVNKKKKKRIMKIICRGQSRTVNNINIKIPYTVVTIISWWSVLLVEETGVPGENN